MSEQQNLPRSEWIGLGQLAALRLSLSGRDSTFYRHTCPAELCVITQCGMHGVTSKGGIDRVSIQC